MADRVLRGSRLGAVSYETDRNHDLAPRRMARYRTDNGEEFEVPFADDAEIPGTWPCKNGLEGTLIDGDLPEPKKVKPPRTHWDMLLERGSIEELDELLKERMEIINVDNGVDYRSQTLEDATIYHHPLGPEAEAAMAAMFDRLAEARDEDPVLRIEAREIHALRRAGGVVWFDFRELCMGPRSQNDYLEIASQFHTVLLSDVPYMPVNMASAARRFTWLVDVLYDRRVKLIISAALPPEQLYTEGPLVHEFPRTVSRLNEMQTREYLQLERRVVDTRLT